MSVSARQFDFQLGTAVAGVFGPDQFPGHGDPGHADAARTHFHIRQNEHYPDGAGDPTYPAAPVRPGVGP